MTRLEKMRVQIAKEQDIWRRRRKQMENAGNSATCTKCGKEFSGTDVRSLINAICRRCRG